MRRLAFASVAWICAALALALPRAEAAMSGVPPIQSTNAIQTCGPVTGTLAAVGDTVALPAGCAGFGTYVITVTTAAGDSAFVGTLQSKDAATGGPRRLHKTGVGALQISTDTLNGSQGSLEYRTCGGAGPQAVTATAATAGKATVTIYGMLSPTACFVNGAVQTAEESALRAGKAFTASTGVQSVTAGQFLSLYIANPASSGVRLVIPASSRILACNNPSNAALPSFFSIPSPTVNVPATAATVTRRGGSSGSSLASAFFANSASQPQTNPATTNPVGLPFFASYSVPQDRTLEPGASLVIGITAVGTGITGATNPSCSIIASWYEESLN